MTGDRKNEQKLLARITIILILIKNDKTVICLSYRNQVFCQFLLL